MVNLSDYKDFQVSQSRRRDCLTGYRVASLKNNVDRSTTIGRMINDYLKGEIDQEDHVIHLLFSANRWEAV